MKWINVKDRLPEDENPVLVFANGAMIEAWYDNSEYCEGWNFIRLNIHGCGCCGDDGDVVTHWMPLPEPPRE